MWHGNTVMSLQSGTLTHPGASPWQQLLCILSPTLSILNGYLIMSILQYLRRYKKRRIYGHSEHLRKQLRHTYQSVAFCLDHTNCNEELYSILGLLSALDIGCIFPGQRSAGGYLHVRIIQDVRKT